MDIEPETVMADPLCFSRGGRFDLVAIAGALNGLRRNIDRVNRKLENHQAKLEDDSLEQMVQAYGMVDRYLSCGVHLLSIGQSREVLAVNHCVLFGRAELANSDYKKALKVSEQHFYRSGIGPMVDWYSRMRDHSIWLLAAGVYLKTVGPPQLFLEGNHRTGVLLANYVLARAGEPPLVIDQQLAPAWFEMTEFIRTRRRSFLEPRYWLRSLESELAALIRDHVNERYLRCRTIPEK